LERKILSIFLVVLLLLLGGIVAETPLIISRALLLSIIIYFISITFIKSKFISMTMILANILLLGVAVVIYYILGNEGPNYILTIFVFSSYALTLFIVWYLIYIFDRSLNIKNSLRNEVISLRRYIDNNNTVFTYDELKDRSEYLIQSCRHYSKKYCIVTIGIGNPFAPPYSAIQHLLQTTLADQLVIPKFDLLGQDEDGNFIVFLQNCNKLEAEKRMEEYLNILKEKIDFKEELLCIDIDEGE
jgi:hypothetical protein